MSKQQNPPPGGPPARPPADRVQSLFGQLEALEDARARTEQALLEGLDHPYSASALADLCEQQQALDAAANELVQQIRQHVEDSSALAVFATRDETVRALAGDDSLPGIPPRAKPR